MDTNGYPTIQLLAAAIVARNYPAIRNTARHMLAHPDGIDEAVAAKYPLRDVLCRLTVAGHACTLADAWLDALQHCNVGVGAVDKQTVERNLKHSVVKAAARRFPRWVYDETVGLWKERTL